MLFAALFEGRMTPRDNDTSGSKDTSTTGLRNREETKREVEMRVRRVVSNEVGEYPAHEFGCRVYCFRDEA